MIAASTPRAATLPRRAPSADISAEAKKAALTAPPRKAHQEDPELPGARESRHADE